MGDKTDVGDRTALTNGMSRGDNVGIVEDNTIRGDNVGTVEDNTIRGDDVGSLGDGLIRDDDEERLNVGVIKEDDMGGSSNCSPTHWVYVSIS